MWPDKHELGIMQIKPLFDTVATWHIFLVCPLMKQFS